jgi:indole-3-glycerol phosphate synthase
MKATPDFLVKVVERKRSRLADAMTARPLDRLRADAYEKRSTAAMHAFRDAVANDRTINVIAEIKKASPSKGELRPDDVNPAEVARAYERGGAVAISVLTEQDYFRGSLHDLTQVRNAVSLPVLRKDFVIDQYQLYESAAAGADAVLLITALLDEHRLTKLRTITEDELGMDALVEVHDSTEMGLAEAAGATLIGVNNRNLRTFEVSLDVSFELAKLKPLNATLISESGLSSGDHLKRLRAVGYRGFLIGEKLMTAEDPENYLRRIITDAEK